MERKTRKTLSKQNIDISKPLDINILGSKDDPCFGKLWDLKAEECARCGDSEFCGIAFSQNAFINRKSIENKQAFKDVEEKDDLILIEKYMNSKIAKGFIRIKVIRLASFKFNISRDKASEIYDNLT